MGGVDRDVGDAEKTRKSKRKLSSDERSTTTIFFFFCFGGLSFQFLRTETFVGIDHWLVVFSEVLFPYFFSYAMAPSRVFVVGVGMTKFEKPGGRDWDYPQMAQEVNTCFLKKHQIFYEKKHLDEDLYILVMVQHSILANSWAVSK